MPIEFKARVLLELGAELISSDAVAIYELVKNSVDAGSTKVSIIFDITMQHSVYRNLHDYLKSIKPSQYDPEVFLEKVEDALDSDAAPKSKEHFLSTIGEPDSIAAARSCLDQAYLEGSSIKFIDWGSGMDKDTLQKGYLTIGTPIRLLEKGLPGDPEWLSKAKVRPKLGEKGIGRLAAMRLGHYVLVETATEEAKQSNWNKLELDWRPIFRNPNLDSTALDYKPEFGRKKDRPKDHGTTITVRDLQSDWTPQKLKELNELEIAKLADPFESDFIQEFLSISLQGKKILLPEFENNKLEYADAVCQAKFEQIEGSSDDNPLNRLQLVVEVEYQHYKVPARTWRISGEHLASCISEEAGKRRKGKGENSLPGSPAIHGC